MDAECTRLVNLLGTCERNKVSRTELANLLGVCDRVARERVEEAQLLGVPIVNLTNGYFVAETKHEMLSYIKREQARADTIYNKCDKLINTEWFD